MTSQSDILSQLLNQNELDNNQNSSAKLGLELYIRNIAFGGGGGVVWRLQEKKHNVTFRIKK